MRVPVWRRRPRTRIPVSMRSHRSAAVFPKKRHKPKPEHVKRSDECCGHPNEPVQPNGLVGPPQNLVFAKESDKWGESCNRKSRYRHCTDGPRKLGASAAQLSHDLFSTD